MCGSWREPIPGWVDNLFAFTGLLVGMGKGVLRSLYVSNGIKLDFIPVDVPINLMIVSAWNTAVGRYKWVVCALGRIFFWSGFGRGIIYLFDC